MFDMKNQKIYLKNDSTRIIEILFDVIDKQYTQ